MKPFSIALRWGEIVCKEFFMQGDIEKAKGMNVSPLMDRDTVVIPQMQLGFINSICTPLFSLLSKLVPDLKVCMDQLQNNAAEWTKILSNAMNGKN